MEVAKSKTHTACAVDETLYIYITIFTTSGYVKEKCIQSLPNNTVS